jgi:imidazolonepropionase
MNGDLLIRNIGTLATLRGPVPRVGAAMADPGLVASAALVARGGRIVFAGPERELPPELAAASDVPVLDAAGAAVLPGLVDAHTHLAFAGDRDDELRERLAGASYAEIATRGGGILKTVAATRAAGREALAALVSARLEAMLLCGTTTAEVKSGYGLDVASEIRSLEAIAQAAAAHPVTVVPTFLGAHEIPAERRADRNAYVRELVDEMIPAVAARGLAEFADVFCETGVFTPAETREILGAAAAHGLGLRVHADELGASGGALVAAELRARSADHLIHATAETIAALAGAGTVATLCPAAAFYLRLGRYAPARALVEAGVPVAIATDVNPGGGLSPSIPFAMTIACFGMGLSLEEAIAAATINGAYSVARQAEAGSLEPGKRADAVVLRSPRLLDLLRVGVPAIACVVKDGRVVVRDGRRV